MSIMLRKKGGGLLLVCLGILLTIFAYDLGKTGEMRHLHNIGLLVGSALLVYLLDYQRPYARVEANKLILRHPEIPLVSTSIEINHIVSLTREVGVARYGVRYRYMAITYLHHKTREEKIYKFRSSGAINQHQLGSFINLILEKNSNVKVDDEFQEIVRMDNVTDSVKEALKSQEKLSGNALYLLHKFEYKTEEKTNAENRIEDVIQYLREGLDSSHVDWDQLKTKAILAHRKINQARKGVFFFDSGLRGRKKLNPLIAVLTVLLAVVLEILITTWFKGR